MPRTARRTRSGQQNSPCIETSDSSTCSVPASFLIRGQLPRDPGAQTARLATQFISQNRSLLSELGATVEQRYDGQNVDLVIRSTTKVGAVPLLSPTTGRPDYGLVVKPRFEWTGLGPMLADMGWRVTPAPLSLPMLPRSERKIPAWVLSSIVLFRLRILLDQLERRFELVHEARSAPRGSVDWASYAITSVARAQFLRVPCRFPDLRDDRDLKGAIRFALQKQLQALEGQRTAGTFVLALITLCGDLLARVRDVAPRVPAPREFESWLRGSLKGESYRDGLRAIEWTADDRGLAGLADLQGLPWVMSMEKFFEAWCEAVLAKVATKIGGTLRSGRLRQTVVPLSWDPPYLGSQKSLLPDLVLERGETTIIVDAKYKEHWEEMQALHWGQLEEQLRERHRADLLQVLAYANLSRTPRIVVCLAYPCSRATWASLRDRGRLFHRASLRAGDRNVDLLLTAFPMGERIEEVASQFAKEVT